MGDNHGGGGGVGIRMNTWTGAVAGSVWGQGLLLEVGTSYGWGIKAGEVYAENAWRSCIEVV